MSGTIPSQEDKTRRRSSWAGRRSLVLMLSLFLLLLLQPLFEQSGLPPYVLVLPYTLILFAALYSVYRHHNHFIVAFVLGAPWVVLCWFPQFREGGAVTAVALSFMIAFLLFVLALLLRSLFHQEHVTAGTLFRAISTYLLLGIVWSAMYALVCVASPDAFRLVTGQESTMIPLQWSQFQYFSFTTLTTLGFGDIVPVSPHARTLAMVEATIGPLYLAILIARLVVMYERTKGQVKVK